jgi:hypothetical protein
VNTSGWVRGYISHNSPVDKFISFVCSTIGSEFDTLVEAIKENNNYIFIMDKYIIKLSKDELKYLQNKGAYTLDKYILDRFLEQGFEFNKHRSQYIEYCYGYI